MGLVVPAVLPSSRVDLEEKLALFASNQAVNRIQIDVVDGKFAAPVSWPYNAPAELGRMLDHHGLLPHLDRLAYEMDLMCLDAESAVAAWLTLGATRFIFHAESTTDLPRLFSFVRQHYGAGDGSVSGLVSFGVALNSASDLALIEPCLDEVAFVQFMGIARIGRQGQPFDRRVFEKVRTFRARHPEVPVQVDGGVSLEVAKELVALGVTNLVVGSAILHARDPVAALAAFEMLENPYGV